MEPRSIAPPFLVNGRILLANSEVPKFVYPTCLLGRQKSLGNLRKKKYYQNFEVDSPTVSCGKRNTLINTVDTDDELIGFVKQPYRQTGVSHVEMAQCHNPWQRQFTRLQRQCLWPFGARSWACMSNS